MQENAEKGKGDVVFQKTGWGKKLQQTRSRRMAFSRVAEQTEAGTFKGNRFRYAVRAGDSYGVGAWPGFDGYHRA
jgi:hypothetical protein